MNVSRAIMNMKWLCIACGIFLLLAIPTGWPSGFYILLRWIISSSSIAVAYGFGKSKLAGWTLVFGAIAFLFNPLFPIYLNKGSWVAIDFVVAVFFFLSAYSIKRNSKSNG